MERSGSPDIPRIAHRDRTSGLVRHRNLHAGRNAELPLSYHWLVRAQCAGDGIAGAIVIEQDYRNARDLAVAIHGVGVIAVRSGIDGLARDDDRDERTKLDGTRLSIYRTIDEIGVSDPCGASRIGDRVGDPHGLALRLCQHELYVRLRKEKRYLHRLQLGDRHEGVRSLSAGCINDVAGLYPDYSGLAADRGTDLRVFEIELRDLQRGLVGTDDRRVGFGGCDRLIAQLRGDGV